MFKAGTASISYFIKVSDLRLVSYVFHHNKEGRGEKGGQEGTTFPSLCLRGTTEN